jgi:ketosteroid isomerase-like protein
MSLLNEEDPTYWNHPNPEKGNAMVLKQRAMLMLIVCFALVFPCFALQEDASTNTDVKALVELHNKALNAQDIKEVMETYADDPNIVLMGTGLGESYVGEEAIGSAYNQIFNRFDANTLNFKYDWITVGSGSNFAWFAVATNVESSLKNEKRERAFNMSGALQKVAGNWRIVSMHFSRLGAEQQQDAEQPK